MDMYSDVDYARFKLCWIAQEWQQERCGFDYNCPEI